MNTLKKKNGKKYLTFPSTDINKEVLTKYIELWDEFKYLIKPIDSGEAGEYRKDYIKIKFNSDDNLHLNKILKLHNLTIVVRSVFQEDGKYYPQVFFR